jgi:thiamine biosynthesis protein ThiI
MKPAMNTYLIKLGELTLKGGNREEFEYCLSNNLRAMAGSTRLRIQRRNGRFFVRCPESDAPLVEGVLDRVIGIAAWAKAMAVDKTPEAVFDACVRTARQAVAGGARTFKIEARRADKGFPLDSYAIMREAGGAVLEAVPELSVDVHGPDATIEVEIRDKAYVYGAERTGRRGLPVGTGGKALLLLSGGIDSPVAGYLMARRGMRISAVHFHAYPYTSREAQDKVAELARILGTYALRVRLTTIPLTKVQLRIKEKAPQAWTTLLSRMAMMDLASRVALASGARCLVTGESVGQVASQTIENMACTESRSALPVLKPLVGTDKIDTIRIAREIGTYETSILPYEDCCVIFSPKHPVLKADLREATALYESLELEPLLEEAFAGRICERG